MTHYLIEIAWGDADFIATLPDLPGCSAWGRTAAEAASHIEDAQATRIEACEASGESVPQPMTPARRAPECHEHRPLGFTLKPQRPKAALCAG